MLASFVAATLRDKTVMELTEERDRLQQRVEILDEAVAHPKVSVTGTNGFPLYAKAKMEDGGPRATDAQRWMVEFIPQPGAAACSSISQLEALEIRLCGSGKKVDVEGLLQYGYFKDYDAETRRGDVTFCLREPCISLFVTIGPLSLQTFNTLAEEQAFELSNFSEVFASTLGCDNAMASTPITVEFKSIQFTHHCHTKWNAPDIDMDDGDY